MQLPGGLVEGGSRRRDCAFLPLTGALELALAEASETACNTPQAVTRALSLALAQLVGDTPSPSRVASLCVADRQFLMRELERHLGCEGGWFQTQCGQCQTPIDFHINYAELPIREAGETYPQASLKTGEQTLSLRLPNGADQEVLATLPESQAAAWLMQQIVIDATSPAPSNADFVARVEAALEAVAPAIVLDVQATCPQCGADNQVELPPYQLLDQHSDALLQEIHQLASHYHWGEAEILAMPRSRRLRYLQLIDRARGLTGE